MEDAERSVAAAMACLDAFMAAFNARDIAAWEQTRSTSRACGWPPTPSQSSRAAITSWRCSSQGAFSDWDHSAWERRAVIHAGEDKVHVDTRFTRYRADGSVIGGFDSIYVVTCEDGTLGREGPLQFRAVDRSGALLTINASYLATHATLRYAFADLQGGRPCLKPSKSS